MLNKAHFFCKLTRRLSCLNYNVLNKELSIFCLILCGLVTFQVFKLAEKWHFWSPIVSSYSCMSDVRCIQGRGIPSASIVQLFQFAASFIKYIGWAIRKLRILHDQPSFSDLKLVNWVYYSFPWPVTKKMLAVWQFRRSFSRLRLDTSHVERWRAHVTIHWKRL